MKCVLTFLLCFLVLHMGKMLPAINLKIPLNMLYQA